jgi:hypothetical protein
MGLIWRCGLARALSHVYRKETIVDEVHTFSDHVRIRIDSRYHNSVSPAPLEPCGVSAGVLSDSLWADKEVLLR